MTLWDGAHPPHRGVQLHALPRDHVGGEAQRQDKAARSARTPRSRAASDGEHQRRRPVPDPRDERSPTLLLDEVDAIFKAREREELRGLLNAGYRRGAVAHRMGGANNRPWRRSPSSAPRLSPASATACRTRSPTARSRFVSNAGPARSTSSASGCATSSLTGMQLADRLAGLARATVTTTSRAAPEASRRARRPRTGRVGTAARNRGPGWLVETSESRRRQPLDRRRARGRIDHRPASRDLHAFFTANGHDRARTSDVLDYLHAIEESPWGDWYGKPLSAHGLSRLLRTHRIKTMPVWVDGEPSGDTRSSSSTRRSPEY